MVASRVPTTGDLAHNPGMCPRLGIELVTPLVRRSALNPLRHTSQGSLRYLLSSMIRGTVLSNSYPLLMSWVALVRSYPFFASGSYYTDSYET